SIAIHPSDPQKVAVATTSGSKVRVSEDGGLTWQTWNDGLPNFSALAVVWDDNGADALYLGMDYGIYYIDNSFNEWQPYSSGLPNVIINELDIHQPTQQLYAASYGRGLWVSDLGSPSLGSNTFVSQNSVKLYPNPSDDHIQIDLKHALAASVRIFDTQGKLIIYIPKGTPSKTYSIKISKLIPGIYFVRLETTEGTVTKKLIKK
ncbi:MAG: T9SS type A sorting domain-containing protein, partial [Flavobacteriaceae bacterium]|nr:T9SS type A sorting domain-containing protein [Flavobacteriaceae bacterium]